MARRNLPNFVNVLRGRAVLVCCVMGLLATAPGCGGCGRGAGVARKPVFPVSGEVYFEGQPIRHAMVVLHPIDEAARAEVWPLGFPKATVAPDGSFRIGTYEEQDGAPEGEYSILVIPTDAALDEPQRMVGDAAPPVTAAASGPGSRFSSPDNPAGRVYVGAQENKIPRLVLSGGA